MRTIAFALLALTACCANPTPEQQAPAVTAVCRDGTKSYSQTAKGTCSHHGGVREWVNHPK